jgi:hypothetical protein
MMMIMMMMMMMTTGTRAGHLLAPGPLHSANSHKTFSIPAHHIDKKSLCVKMIMKTY